ncbi:hypothetical protein L7F22_038395 [Adiantum nelumboides]|nr:hypothetical protein [Adiantum nelumboides]
MDALRDAQMQRSISGTLKAAYARDGLMPRPFLHGAGLKAPSRRVPACFLRLHNAAGGVRCLRSSNSNSNGSSAFRWGAGDFEYLEAQVLEAGTYETLQGIFGSL